MRLEVLRFSSCEDSTSGLLFDVSDGGVSSYATLEDEHRDVKVMSEQEFLKGLIKYLKNSWWFSR